jgi:hypothetical protein
MQQNASSYGFSVRQEIDDELTYEAETSYALVQMASVPCETDRLSNRQELMMLAAFLGSWYSYVLNKFSF